MTPPTATGAPAALLPWLGDPPVSPDRQQAARWAAEELARREYQEARPGLVTRALRWLLEHLPDLPVGPGSQLVLVLLLGLVVLAVVYAVARVGIGRSAARRRATGGLFGDVARSAAEHRGEADRAAAAGDWSTAVLERFRAVARELEDRAVLGAQPGRTADELAAEAGAALPDLADRLRAGAETFDEVRYGGVPGDPAGDERLRALDQAVQQARTVPAVRLTRSGGGR
jgi:hypothetical protein